jgi:L-amino acid N-acyltransferase YncA
MLLKIRTATVGDARSMLDIYRPYILETPITFETEVPSLEEFQGRVSTVLSKFPWLVCERDNQIVGYAYAGAFRSRRAYDWSVESSVYVLKGSHHTGVGSALYRALLELLGEQGVVNVIGGMTLPNPASEALHGRFGFTKVAHFKDAGYKLGQWWDVGFWQLQLARPEIPRPMRVPRAIMGAKSSP